MKNKILSFVRVLVVILMLAATILVVTVPTAAYPASFADGYTFTPFHMMLKGTVTEQTNSSSYDFTIPLPNISYDFLGDRTFTSSSTLDTDIDVGLNIGQSYFVENQTLSTFNDVLSIDLNVSASSAEFESVIDDFSVFFQGGFLDSSFSMSNSNDGVAFVAYDEYGTMLPGALNGEFYVGSNPGYEFSCSRRTYDDGAYLSYYDVLYHSNYPFMDNLPDGIDPVEWGERFDTYADYDFFNLTQSQIQDLNDLFSWVGPIFGRFSIKFYYPDYYYVQDINFSFKYVLTDIVHVSHRFENVIEDTVYSGLTGFERVTKFLGSAVQGFFSVEILPSFSLGGIVVVIISFSLVLWWLKVFAGG